VTAGRERDGPRFSLVDALVGTAGVAHALWRKTAAEEISAREADEAFDLVTESGIDLRPTGPLVPRAMDAARRLQHPVYDCVYLALAEREHAAFVTADHRLLRRLATSKLGISVIDLRAL
jgi:predicted nucleic acid-binding protein